MCKIGITKDYFLEVYILVPFQQVTLLKATLSPSQVADLNDDAKSRGT